MGHKLESILAAMGCILLPLLLVTGCGSSGNGQDIPGADRGDADIRGDITNISVMESGAGGMLGSILIEGELEKDTQFDKASVTVTEETRIFRQLDDETVEADFADLSVGQRVQAVFTGPVAESYPVQATAAEIVILGAADGITDSVENPDGETSDIEPPDVTQVKAEHEADLMAIEGVIGVGISGTEEEPVIVVYLLSNNPQLLAQIPDELDGVKVFKEVTGPIDIQP
jgi:hypothetical protein